LLDIYPKWQAPLPFAYESTGVEMQFTNRLDPDPKSRNVFAFHKPETLLEWLQPEQQLNTRLAGARRVLFLVDRGNLGDQTLKEFQQFVTPDDGRKFTELYNVQHLKSSQLDKVSRVCISTIQRLYSMLREFFFGLNNDAAKWDRREETGMPLSAFNEACGTISVAR